MSTGSAGPVTRRRFLVRTGHGALAVAVLGLAACAGSDDDAGPATRRSTDPATASTAPETASSTSQPADAAHLAWNRVDLGFVAAYVLVRGNVAAVVDTGVGGSADAIGAVLKKAGPGWEGVRHVVLTHKHPDHAGSIGDVLTRAARATGYIGAKDLAEVTAPRKLHPLEDGDDVFGLQIVGSPGHTLGHVAVFDHDTGVLVAGDALTHTGELTGSNPQFTEDKGAATNSVRKLARLRPTTILVGHGEPVVHDAAVELDRLAASLG
jgi:glyoxylase-like metal-dependent hydrolase (beta-lactamase superfamily II)